MLREAKAYSSSSVSVANTQPPAYLLKSKFKKMAALSLFLTEHQAWMRKDTGGVASQVT